MIYWSFFPFTLGWVAKRAPLNPQVSSLEVLTLLSRLFQPQQLLINPQRWFVCSFVASFRKCQLNILLLINGAEFFFSREETFQYVHGKCWIIHVVLFQFQVEWRCMQAVWQCQNNTCVRAGIWLRVCSWVQMKCKVSLFQLRRWIWKCRHCSALQWQQETEAAVTLEQREGGRVSHCMVSIQL